MKKKIQALVCAAMLALAGFNVWTAKGVNETADLKIEGVEMLAEGESEVWPEIVAIAIGLGYEVWDKASTKVMWEQRVTIMGRRTSKVEWVCGEVFFSRVRCALGATKWCDIGENPNN